MAAGVCSGQFNLNWAVKSLVSASNGGYTSDMRMIQIGHLYVHDSFAPRYVECILYGNVYSYLVDPSYVPLVSAHSSFHLTVVRSSVPNG